MGTLVSIAAISGGVIGLIGILITLATVLGGSFRVAKNARIIADYKSGYDAIAAKSAGQEQQIAELERENTEKDHKITELRQEMSQMQGRISVLQDEITGRSAIEALTVQLAGLAETMNSRYGETLALVGELKTEAREAHKRILSAVSTGT